MFFDHDLKAPDLPRKTLCLTYDDGPGPDTFELGRYLYAEGISATFFVIGRNAEKQTDVLAQLAAWGHELGNHTYSHTCLVALAESGGDVVGEVARTDALIRRHVRKPVVFLRAPYGNWRPGIHRNSGNSRVADILNRSARFADYLGPINWDISAADYDFWKRDAPPEKCAGAYFDLIARMGQGIVLLHDGSQDPAVQPRNRVLEATKLLVPALKAQGYRFVALSDTSQIRLALSACGAPAVPRAAVGLPPSPVTGFPDENAGCPGTGGRTSDS